MRKIDVAWIMILLIIYVACQVPESKATDPTSDSYEKWQSIPAPPNAPEGTQCWALNAAFEKAFATRTVICYP